MRQSRQQVYAASLLAGAAALWPTLLCALADALRTPYQRALADTWCGTGPNAVAFLGHCPACWIGAATLTLAALFVAFAPSRPPAARRRAI